MFASRRLCLERLESRDTPAWASPPPFEIDPPTEVTEVTFDSDGDAAGDGTVAGNDIAFFRFTAPRDGMYTFRAVGGPIDTIVAVYDEFGLMEGFDNDSGAGTNSLLVVELFADEVFDYGVTRLEDSPGGDFTWSIDGPGEPPAEADGFQITLRFGRGITPRYRPLLQAAARRWEAAIVGDLPQEEFNGTFIDDMLIDVTARGIDGPNKRLGFGGPGALRFDSGLPYYGTLVFDRTDLPRLRSSGELASTALHEIGHALGFGTVWGNQELVERPSPRAAVFVGVAAVEEYSRLLGGRDVTGVPLERDGSHWRERSFGVEVLTPTLNGGRRNPLSRLTIASMEDIGYEVNYAAAQPYVLPRR